MFPTVRVIVEGQRDKAAVDALLDTGFSGFLCLPTEKAVELGLMLKGRDIVEYADGTRKDEIYFEGKVAFAGKTIVSEIYLTNSDEPLLGIKLLEGCQLLLDFVNEKLKVTRIKPKKKTD